MPWAQLGCQCGGSVRVAADASWGNHGRTRTISGPAMMPKTAPSPAQVLAKTSTHLKREIASQGIERQAQLQHTASGPPSHPGSAQRTWACAARVILCMSTASRASLPAWRITSSPLFPLTTCITRTR